MSGAEIRDERAKLEELDQAEHDRLMRDVRAAVTEGIALLPRTNDAARTEALGKLNRAVWRLIAKFTFSKQTAAALAATSVLLLCLAEREEGSPWRV